MRALPEEEAAEPLLAGRADDEVGVGLPRGVEVLGDVLDVERLGELVEARAGLGVQAQERADGVGDLAPAAVPDGGVDVQPLDVGRRVLRRLEGGGGAVGQHVERADGLDPPAALGGELADDVLDDPQQRLELLGVAGEVVGREQPQGDDLDADVLAPLEEVADLVRSPPPARRGGHTAAARPAAVAVEDDADVPWHLVTGQRGCETAFVQAVEQLVRHAHARASLGRQVGRDNGSGRGCAVGWVRVDTSLTPT